MGVIYTASPVHQIAAQVAGKPAWTVISRCGVVTYRSQDLPDDYSGWHCQVTCEACLHGPPGEAALLEWMTAANRKQSMARQGKGES